ncbi:MAG: PilZ domain-containing protein [Desulfofustis sp.]|nr:PilZ domain-containing protein [Desulfofustis sp.]
MEKREHPRMDVLELQADISDGNDFFAGTVKNISRFGLAIADIPTELNHNADIYSVILDGPGIHFKLLVRPVWEAADKDRKTIGALIENSPWTWTEYVMGKEPLTS